MNEENGTSNAAPTKKPPRKKGKNGGKREGAGKPSKILLEICRKSLLEALKAGAHLETAAAFAGMDKVTLWRWTKRGAKEMQRMEKAGLDKPDKDEAPYVALHKELSKAMASSEVRDLKTIGMHTARYWQAAAWRLERVHPDKYAKREVHDINTNIDADERRENTQRMLNDPEARKLAAGLERRVGSMRIVTGRNGKTRQSG